jgi:serine/threonine protein kinase
MNSDPDLPTRPPKSPTTNAEPVTAPVSPDTTPRAAKRATADGLPVFDPLPASFGRYQVQKLLGAGGMGAVYLAHDSQLDRRVALKIPRFAGSEGPQVRERFVREARAAATVQHAHICPLHDVGESDGIPYMTMAFIDGRSLSEVLRSQTVPLKPRTVAILMRKLAMALEEAHRHKVIHRDLKPANIMITKRGDPVVMDFGLARRGGGTDPRLTAHGAIMGTPAYMAPEQARGDPDAMGPACDIYSLGVILYQLLAGRLPFVGDTMAILTQLAVDEPKPPSAHRPGVDPALEAICVKAMAKAVGDRYRSMTALVGVLTEYLKQEPPDSETIVQQSAIDAAGPGSSDVQTEQLSGSVAAIARPASRWWVYSALAVVASALFFGVVGIAGIVYYFATNEGTIAISLSDPAAKVDVMIDGKPISPDTPLRLAPGSHVLEVSGKGYRTIRPEFVVARGTNPPLQVTLEPDAAQAKGVPPPKDLPPPIDPRPPIQPKPDEPKLPPEPKLSPLEQSARTLVDLMDRGEYDRAAAAFNANMLKTIPPQQLKKGWEQMVDTHGPFQKATGSRLDVVPGKHEHVVVSCDFAKGKLDVLVSFDKDAKVSGMWFLPPGTKSLPPRITYTWPAEALRNGTITLPDLSKVKPLFTDRFADPKGALPHNNTPDLEKGYLNGKYVFQFRAVGNDVSEIPANRLPAAINGGDFAIALTANAFGGLTRWGLLVSDRDQPAMEPIALLILGSGQVYVGHDPGGTPAKKLEGSAVRHPKIVEAGKMAEARNTVQILVKGRILEVYVNGSAVVDPVHLKRPIAVPRLSLSAATSRAKGAHVDFESMTIWPTNNVPSLEARGAILHKKEFGTN